MEENHNNRLDNTELQDTKKRTDVTFYREVQGIVSFEQITLTCSLVRGLDENGLIRETCEGDSYRVSINNGVLSFDRPLKFKANG
uniref:hypothetical protein n=1 Tax=Mariniflexile sp. TaxID=1979402 RepID=UPI004047368D